MKSLFRSSLFLLFSGILSIAASAKDLPTGVTLYRQRGSLSVELEHSKWLQKSVLTSLAVRAEVAWSAGLPQRLKLTFVNPIESNLPYLPAEIVLRLSAESRPGTYILNLESGPSGEFTLATNLDHLTVGSVFGTLEVKNKGRTLVVRPSSSISLRARVGHRDRLYRRYSYNASGNYCLEYWSMYWHCRKKKSVNVKQETESIELRMTGVKGY